MTIAWTPAETDQGSRAFTAAIGDVDVLVTYAGGPTGTLTGAWEVVDANARTPLLDGVDPALVGSHSAVLLYASLVDIADRLTPLLSPTSPIPVQYKVVELVARDASTFTDDVEAILNTHAAEGWRLVAVDDLWAYLERPGTV